MARFRAAFIQIFDQIYNVAKVNVEVAVGIRTMSSANRRRAAVIDKVHKGLDIQWIYQTIAIIIAHYPIQVAIITKNGSRNFFSIGIIGANGGKEIQRIVT